MNSICNLINLNKSLLKLGLRNTGLGRLPYRFPFFNWVFLYELRTHKTIQVITRQQGFC